MEAEFKSSRQFVPPLIGIFQWLKLVILPKSVVFNHFNVYFQQY